MHKKPFIIILLSHLIVPLSLLFPVFKVGNKLTNTSVDKDFVNIIGYVQINVYGYITVVLVIFMIMEILGIVNSINGIRHKELKHAPIRNSFYLGFSSAVLGATFISVGSYVFFAVCAASFLVISYFSIKLMKMEP